MAQNFTRSQVAEFKEAFKVFDKDDSGFITIDELESVMKAMGHAPSKPEVQAILSEVEKDTCIYFSEFLVMMGKMASEYDENILQAFRAFDKNNSGKISPNELKQAMAQLGDKLSDEEIADMIKAADSDGDGLIDYNEFLKMMKSQ